MRMRNMINQKPLLTEFKVSSEKSISTTGESEAWSFKNMARW